MKEKLKLILLLAVIAAASIMIVLGTWLYGSYNQRIGLFKSAAERCLFDAFQKTIREMLTENTSKVQHTGAYIRASKKVVEGLTKQIPGISETQIQTVLDSIWQEESLRIVPLLRKFDEGGKNPKRFLFPKNGKQNVVIPMSFLVDISIDQHNLLYLQKYFNEYLKQKSLEVNYNLKVEKIVDIDLISEVAERNKISLRPLLIDPDKHMFIAVSFDKPWKFVFYSMSWQLIISVFILAVVAFTFIYLFLTILRQNRLSLLRKTFINGLTHELRTPLSIVYMAVEGIRDCGNFQKGTEKQENYYVLAIEELNNLTAMIDNVLHLAEGDYDQSVKLLTSDFDIVALVQETMQYIEQYKPGVALSFDCSMQTLSIEADKTHIRNVLHNVLDNAVKYGSNYIIIRLVDVVKNNVIVIEIEDNGVGIQTAYQDQIFEPFFRVPQGDSYSVKGFGIGLSYSKQVVQLHGGQIKLKSEERKGTTFTIIIPKNQ